MAATLPSLGTEPTTLLLYQTLLNTKKTDVSKESIFDIAKKKRERLEEISKLIDELLKKDRGCMGYCTFFTGIAAIVVGIFFGVIAGARTAAFSAGVLKAATPAAVVGTLGGCGCSVGGCCCCNHNNRLYKTYESKVSRNLKLLDEVDPIFRLRFNRDYNELSSSPISVVSNDKPYIDSRIAILKTMENRKFFQYLSVNNLTSLFYKNTAGINDEELKTFALWRNLEIVASNFDLLTTQTIVQDMVKEKREKEGEDTSGQVARIEAIVNGYIMGDDSSPIAPPSPLYADRKEANAGTPAATQALVLQMQAQFPNAHRITPTGASTSLAASPQIELNAIQIHTLAPQQGASQQQQGVANKDQKS